MTWRLPRKFLPVLLILVVLIVGIGFAVVYIRSHSSANISIIWQINTPAFTAQDQQDILRALNSALSTPNLGTVAGHEFTIIDAQRQGDWATLSAVERVSHDAQPIQTEPSFFLVHRQGTTWSAWLPNSSGFCDQLKQVPDTLLNATDKGYFC